MFATTMKPAPISTTPEATPAVVEPEKPVEAEKPAAAHPTVSSTYARVRDTTAALLPVALAAVLVTYADKLAALCPVAIPGREEGQGALAAVDALLVTLCGKADTKVDAFVAKVTGRANEIKSEAEKRVVSAKTHALELKTEAEKRVESVKAEAKELKAEALSTYTTAKKYVPAVKAVVVEQVDTLTAEIKKEGLVTTAAVATKLAKDQANEVYTAIRRDGVVAYTSAVKDAVVSVIVEADAKLASSPVPTPVETELAE